MIREELASQRREVHKSAPEAAREVSATWKCVPVTAGSAGWKALHMGASFALQTVDGVARMG